MNYNFIILVIYSVIIKLEEDNLVLGVLIGNSGGGRDRSTRSQCALPTIPNGMTRLRQRGRLVKFQCNKSFKLIGSVYAGCLGGKWDTPIPVCAKPGCPDIIAPQNGFTMLEHDGAMALLFCKSNYQLAGGRKTFCNGSKWDRPLGSCRETQTTPQRICDFEVEDICGWTHDDTDDFQWERTLGGLSRRLRTGPQHDHTTQKSYGGHYMLIESFNHLPDDRARLISPIYASKLSKDSCFKFFYHMYGATVGDLRIYVKPLSVDIITATQDRKYLYFEVSGNQGNRWREGVIFLESIDENFQIIIEGSAGTSHLSDIAIDDVALLNENECIIDTIETTTTETEESGGIFDIQSCKNRCDETTSASQQSGGYKIMKTGPENGVIKTCDCHSGCEDLMTCCPDYRSICAFGTTYYSVADENITEIPELKTTPIQTTSTLNLTILTTTTTTTRKPTTTTRTTPTTTTRTTPTTTTRTTPTTTTRTTPTTTSKTTPTTTRTTSTTTIRTTPTTTIRTTPTTTIRTTPTTTIRTTPTTVRTIPTTTSRTTPTTVRTIPTTKSTTKKIVPTTLRTSTTNSTPSTSTKKPTKTTMVSYRIIDSNENPYITLPKYKTSTVRNDLITAIDYFPKKGVTPITQKTHYFEEQHDDPDSIATAVVKNHHFQIIEKVAEKTSLPIWTIIIISIVSTVVLITILVYAINYYRYYYGPENYKNNMDKFSKNRNEIHSDVIYLASDEQLDFTMQRLDDGPNE